MDEPIFTRAELGLDLEPIGGQITEDELESMRLIICRVNRYRLQSSVCMSDIAREIGASPQRVVAMLTGRRKPTRPVIRGLTQFLEGKPIDKVNELPIDALARRLIYGDGLIDVATIKVIKKG